MKKHLYSAALIALLSTTLNISSAKAEANHREPQRGGSSATCLPINSNVVFLMIAGIFIGIAAVTKTKSLKAN